MTDFGALWILQHGFCISGSEPGTWFLDLKSPKGSCGSGEPADGKADCTMQCDSADFVKMFMGNLKPTAAFMTGKLKIKGDIGKAMKLEKLMGEIKLGKVMESKL